MTASNELKQKIADDDFEAHTSLISFICQIIRSESHVHEVKNIVQWIQESEEVIDNSDIDNLGEVRLTSNLASSIDTKYWEKYIVHFHRLEFNPGERVLIKKTFIQIHKQEGINGWLLRGKSLDHNWESKVWKFQSCEKWKYFRLKICLKKIIS